MDIRFADTIFWVAVVSCVVAQVAIVRSLLRMRGAIAASGMTRPRVAAEFTWVVVPAIALAAILIMTWRAIHPEADAAATGTPTLARVTATTSAR